jgi:hypothetical protein
MIVLLASSFWQVLLSTILVGTYRRISDTSERPSMMKALPRGFLRGQQLTSAHWSLYR